MRHGHAQKFRRGATNASRDSISIENDEFEYMKTITSEQPLSLDSVKSPTLISGYKANPHLTAVTCYILSDW